MDTPVYEYVLLKQDFLNAQKLFRRSRPKAAISYWLYFWVCPILGCVAIGITLFGLAAKRPHLVTLVVPFAVGGLVFAIFVPVHRWYQLRRAWNNCVPASLRGKPVTFQFDDTQLISTVPGRSEGRFFWSAVLDLAEDSQLALLFVREKNFLFIPKTALTAEAWDRVRLYAPKERRRLE